MLFHLKKIFITSILLITSISSVFANDLLDQVTKKGVLTVGLESTYPPFSFRDKSGNMTGYDVDVVTAIAEKLNVRADFKTAEWSALLAGLQAKKFDILANQVAITEERKKVFDFSVPYAYSSGQLIQRKNDNRSFPTLESLKKFKLGVTMGTTYAVMANAVRDIDVLTYPGAPEYLRDLAAGRIDAAFNDRLMVAYLLKNSALPLKEGSHIGKTTEMGIPIRKNNPKMIEAINKALIDLKNDGTLKRISEKWFGVDISVPASH